MSEDALINKIKWLERRIEWLEYNLRLATDPSSGGCITCAHSDFKPGAQRGVCIVPVADSLYRDEHNSVIFEGSGKGCPAWKQQNRSDDRFKKRLQDV